MATLTHLRQQRQSAAGLDALMEQAHGVILDALNRELQVLDITAAQYVIIVNLANSRTESIAALCKLLAYDPGAMTRMVRRLERKGLVTRLRSPQNNRAITLELTAAGWSIYPKLIECITHVLDQVLADFSQDETSKLKELLHKLLSKI
ncbi:MarR family transcriptional regulator [Collimonas fungivorans]|uniref:MarR family transcriptional regulator n=1 Tax=Collimonas fungivorans TaxID=158899 RepID=UPI0026EB127D|nr:MarR family transcriptional regulator [Collimonas fungivorans]